MGAVRIVCPKCGRILGDTDKSIDCNVNCPRCKAVRIKMRVTTFSDYIRKEDA